MGFFKKLVHVTRNLSTGAWLKIAAAVTTVAGFVAKSYCEAASTALLAKAAIATAAKATVTAAVYSAAATVALATPAICVAVGFGLALTGVYHAEWNTVPMA